MGPSITLLHIGFYSWINDEMKDKLLNIISNHLADNGIAYVCPQYVSRLAYYGRGTSAYAIC